MNQNIYVSQVTDIVRGISGVINVVDVRFYNMAGGNYSNTSISQATGRSVAIPNTTTIKTEIAYVDNAIFSSPISIFEIRYPEVDILIRIS